MSKFRFTKETTARLKANGKEFDKVLFDACLEAGVKKVKASEFCEALRATGFRIGTGPARAAYKMVRDGGDITAMIAAVTAVKAKRKSVKAGVDGADGAGTDTGKDGAGTDTGKDGTDTGTNTLVGALQAACDAAKRGNLVIVETWLVKAQAILDTAKTATAAAIEKMGGVA